MRNKECCAHLKVIYSPKQEGMFKVSNWECEVCGKKFIPVDNILKLEICGNEVVKVKNE